MFYAGAGFIDTVNGPNILGEIDAEGQSSHEFPPPSKLMRDRATRSGTTAIL